MTKNDICIIDISDISKEYINLPTLTSHHSSLERMMIIGLIFMRLVSETLGGDFLRKEIFSLYTKKNSQQSIRSAGHSQRLKSRLISILSSQSLSVTLHLNSAGWMEI